MKKIVLSLLIIQSFLFSCGLDATKQDGSDTTPPTFMVTVERVDKETSRSDGSIDISSANATLRITGREVLKVHVQVFDKESGVRSVSFVKKTLLNVTTEIEGNFVWKCLGSGGELTGTWEASSLTFDQPLPPATLSGGYGVLLVADPWTQTTNCINNEYSVLEGRIQISAINGDGLTANSGELFFEKPQSNQ